MAAKVGGGTVALATVLLLLQPATSDGAATARKGAPLMGPCTEARPGPSSKRKKG